jgi:hypothetical protein
MHQTALKTNHRRQPSASIAHDVGADPTRGLEDQSTADPQRDPTAAGAPAELPSDPTAPRGNRPVGHVVGHPTHSA